MQEAEARRLCTLLSPLRLAEYQLACGGDTVAALRLHCWNTEISEAFYGPLQYLEVAIRSAMTRELTGYLRRDDWWNDPRPQLTYGGRQRISEAERQLQRIGLTPTPHMVSEELPFGFYVSLLGPGNGYGAPPCTGPFPPTVAAAGSCTIRSTISGSSVTRSLITDRSTIATSSPTTRRSCGASATSTRDWRPWCDSTAGCPRSSAGALDSTAAARGLRSGREG
ncbi:hypothetical protein [Nonomuraea sp. NPDC002799]